MSSEYNDAGNEDLREYIVSASGWTHIAVVLDDGTEETRIDTTDDGRGEWSDPTANPVTLTLEVNGDDSDIDTPVEIAGTALFADGGATEALHDDNFEGANVILDAGDELTIEHEIQQPEV